MHRFVDDILVVFLQVTLFNNTNALAHFEVHHDVPLASPSLKTTTLQHAWTNSRSKQCDTVDDKQCSNPHNMS